LRLYIAPVLLGRGQRLFGGVDRTEFVQVEVRHIPLVSQPPASDPDGVDLAR
jgi:hypothetical protein